MEVLTMLEIHPTREELEGFMLGDLAPDTTRRVLRHLLSDCEHCQEATGQMWDVGSSHLPASMTETSAHAGYAGPRGRFDYDWALDRVFERVRKVNSALLAERIEAQERFSELLRHPLERRLILIQNSPRYQSWG
ncbi:MAG TPA: hypothetical protein VMM92_07605, partial [Thermoanaerobaculia bacterium]|nr:hypothetical protein [Thermoanaerobaculia bacterium]